MSDPQQQSSALPATLAAVTALVTGVVAAVQLKLLTEFAALIAKYGVGDLLLFSMRRTARAAADGLGAELPSLVAQVVERATHDGAAGGSGHGHPTPPGGLDPERESHAQRSARAIREDMLGKLNLLTYRVTRFADDVYRAVTADAARAQVLGLTPAQAHHEAYRKTVRQGVTGFVDSKGRNWELSAYVEMATRTAAERAYNVSHLERMQSLGFDLCTVTDDGHPCPLCLPWQGKILSAVPNVAADATIADAAAAGLWHPNCKHSLVGYLPGVTEIPAPHEWSADDQRLYDESQMQRRLERDIRAAKRELAAAFSPEMRTQAQFQVRRAQARMRDFIAQTGRVRNTRREQIALGAKN